MAKNLDLGNRKLALGKASCESMLTAEKEDLPEVVHVAGEVSADDENIINIEKTEEKITQEEVHHALKGVPSIQERKGILRKGVTIAVF